MGAGAVGLTGQYVRKVNAREQGSVTTLSPDSGVNHVQVLSQNKVTVQSNCRRPKAGLYIFTLVINREQSPHFAFGRMCLLSLYR